MLMLTCSWRAHLCNEPRTCISHRHNSGFLSPAPSCSVFVYSYQLPRSVFFHPPAQGNTHLQVLGATQFCTAGTVLVWGGEIRRDTKQSSTQRSSFPGSCIMKCGFPHERVGTRCLTWPYRVSCEQAIYYILNIYFKFN